MSSRIECPFEEVLRAAGYVQVYDGQAAIQKRNEQFNIPPEERRFFVRHYQKVENNRFVEKFAKLVYDFRSGWCTECDIYKKAPNGMRQARQTMVSQEGLTNTK